MNNFDVSNENDMDYLFREIALFNIISEEDNTEPSEKKIIKK